ncbi:MAG: hypothetical protein L0Y43_05045 [Methylococcaceae bacterium]|nr:hypothetical protein [Methylococcaceae bacterium]
MKQKVKPTLAAIIAGLGSGILATGATLYYRSGAPGNDGRALIELKTDPVSRPDTVSMLSTRGIEIEKSNRERIKRNQMEVERLNKRIDDLIAERAVEPSDEPQPPTLEGIPIEQARADDLNWWEETKAAFDQEPIDPRWATPTSDSFMTDIEDLASKHEFVAVQTDCRSTLCAAVVEWPTYGDAVQQFAELLHHSYQVNCVRHTVLPEPSEDYNFDAPYRATVIFDCAELREGVAVHQ